MISQPWNGPALPTEMRHETRPGIRPAGEGGLRLGRRRFLAAACAAGLLRPGAADAAPGGAAPGGAAPGGDGAAEVRIASLRFGSLSWELDVMTRHGLDRQAGFRAVEVPFAASQATQVALQAGAVDLAVQDWLWAARQRDSGGDWVFAPFSNETGGLLVPGGSTLRDPRDLPGKRFGVAGGPIDKSWLIVRAYARKVLGFDPQTLKPFFGTPPLLSEQMARGRLDAVLTYWPFVAREEARGARSILRVGDTLTALGLPADTPLIGYVYRAAWAAGAARPAQRFLEAAAHAQAILGSSDAEWETIRPLTGAADDRELQLLRDAYRAGIPRRWGQQQIDAAQSLLGLLHDLPGAEAAGLPVHVPPGLFPPQVTL